MSNIVRHTFQHAWQELLYKLIDQYDYQVKPRDILTREILGVRLEVEDLRQNILFHPERNLNYKFMVAEWLWITFGRNDVATLKQYNSQMARFSDDGERLAGAYGPRLHPQWEYLVDTLVRDRNSRQAVATIWTPNPGSSKDVPCTVACQFLIRDGQLNSIWTMRSSDIWLGLPYDFFTFSQLTNAIAGLVGVPTGRMIMNLGSSHIYDTNIEAGKRITHDSAWKYAGVESPQLPGWPQPGLEDVLVSPGRKDTLTLDQPWETYGKVLGAATWSEALCYLKGR